MAERYWACTWCPKANCSSALNNVLLAAQLSRVALRPWTVSFRARSGPACGSSNSLNHPVASAVDILDSTQRCALSDHEHKNSFQVLAWLSCLASIQLCPQHSSHVIFPKAVKGSSSICCSLPLEDLCFDVKASKKKMSPASEDSSATTYIESCQRAAAAKLNKRWPAMTLRCSASSFKQMRSSSEISVTVKTSAGFLMRFVMKIEWAAPVTRALSISCNRTCVKPIKLSANLMASTSCDGVVEPAPESLKWQMYLYNIVSPWPNGDPALCDWSQHEKRQRELHLFKTVPVAFGAKTSINIWASSSSGHKVPAKLRSDWPSRVASKSNKTIVLNLDRARCL